MEYNITKSDLDTEWLYLTILAVSECLNELAIPMYIVGAQARNIILQLHKADPPKRKTRDLDIAVALKEWTNFEKLCAVLQQNNFNRVGNTHKFHYKGIGVGIDYELDIVPFGEIAIDETIYWPPEGNPAMSVKCYNDIMNHAVSVLLENKVKFMIAPLFGQFMIKLDAWNDRHLTTDKDMEDMAHIIHNYFNIRCNDSSTFPEEINIDNVEEGIDVWGAQWLALDIAPALSTEHLRFYTNRINEELEKEEESKLISDFMKYHRPGSYRNYLDSRAIWSKFSEVLNKELLNRKS